jgi:FixJ family two-component response regulator
VDKLKRAYVVDDDEGVCESLVELLQMSGIEAIPFTSSRTFMEAVPNEKGPFIAILDLQMPEINGLTLMEMLREQVPQCPVIFLTGRGDVESATHGMKLGAIDFLQKPVEPERLLEVVEWAFGLAQTRCEEKDRKNSIDGLFQKLTPREREICLFLSKGYTAKEIGRSLNISPRTAEIHRSRIMEKLTVDSNADLVSLAIAQGLRD